MNMTKLFVPAAVFAAGCFSVLQNGCHSVVELHSVQSQREVIILDRDRMELGADQSIRCRFRFDGSFRRGKDTLVLTGPKPFGRKFLQPGYDGTFLECGTEKYYFNGIARRDFSWPDSLLALSTELAAKQECDPAKERIFTFDLVRRNGRLRFYVDERLLLDAPFAPGVPAVFECKMRGKAQIVSLEREVVKPFPEHFEMLPLSSLASSEYVGKDKLQLPHAGKYMEIDSIPFVVPEGGRHIDVGRSFVRETALIGAHPGSRGVFGGRWAGALSANPARIQLRIPNRSYRAIHLLAASDGEKDSFPRVSVQFYKVNAGFPKTFVSEKIPTVTARQVASSIHPIPLGEGKNLYQIVIPIDSGMLAECAGWECLELELTKEVHPHRDYPDPAYYSFHGAGLPSSVHVFGMTLEADPVEVKLAPKRFAHVFMEDEKVEHTVTLHNTSSETIAVPVRLRAVSFDKTDKVEARENVTLKPGETRKVTLLLHPLKRFGHYDLTLEAGTGRTVESAFARLRRRADQKESRPFDDPRHIFGFWPSGAHGTPAPVQGVEVMGKAGAKAYTGAIASSQQPQPNIPGQNARDAALLHKKMREYGMKTYLPFGFIDFRYTGFDFPRPEFKVTFDAAKPDEMREKLAAKLCELDQGLSDVIEPRIVRIFGEPGGIGSHRTPGCYSGEKEMPMTPEELERFKLYSAKLKLSGTLLRERYPNLKILAPHGDPAFILPFLKDPELAGLIDGVALDYGYFDRLPEMQIGQNAIHRTLFLLDTWKKYKKNSPWLGTFEGPCLGPVATGSLTARESAAHTVRSALVLSGYGVTQQHTAAGVFAPASWYGEQHYAGGLLHRPPMLHPYPGYSAYATMTRHLGDKLRPVILPAADMSSYCYEYACPDDPKRSMYVLWLIRGTRQVTFDHAVEVCDLMDNGKTLKKGARCEISDLPVFVYGPKNLIINWGEARHDDAQTRKHTLRLGNLGDGTWKKTSAEDEVLYRESDLAAVRKFPADMKLDIRSGHLAVTLPDDAEDRGVMPHFIALAPSRPITIPGRGAKINLEVEGVGDWGRIVYLLRDASGQRLVSCGMRDAYNCDDTQGRSILCFSGKRLLQVELPSNMPYDRAISSGSTWWGMESPFAEVKLPLTLEKIIVERRQKVVYGNRIERCPEKAVVLGALSVEYDSAADCTGEAVKRDKITARNAAEAVLPNPVESLRKRGTLPAVQMRKVEHPSTHFDGTRGIFYFDTSPQAVWYDVYIAQHADGRGAIRCGERIRTSGSLVRGFLPGRDFYAFVVYYDKNGAQSTVSKPFKFRLDDVFGMK